MKINWAIRFRNPVWVTAFVGFLISTVYQLMTMFDIAPAITQDAITQVVAAVVQLLTLMGILVDPTSKGVSDSEYVLAMKAPEE